MSEIANNSESSPKKRKLSDADDTADKDTSNGIQRKFDGFEIIKVLNENSQRKMICVEGRLGNDSAVAILEKTPLSEDVAGKILSKQTKTQAILENDIYGTYHLHPDPELNALKATLICPATEKHVAKYTSQEMFLIEETAEEYTSITKPYLQTTTFSNQWVYNILEKKTESERIVFEDPDPDTGFILLPDMKWDGKQKEDLYLVAIVHRKDIGSLRELRGKHLLLLENMRDKGRAAIAEKYQVPSSQLRIYFHYQPSYYHLHVHFTHLKYDAPGSGVEKAHLLTDVIENLHMDAEFYRKKTLPFTVKKTESLYKCFEEARAKEESSG